MDYDGYVAELHVAPYFGCNMFKPASIGERRAKIKLLGIISLQITVTDHITKDDPLFKFAQEELEAIKKEFESTSGFMLKKQKYKIFSLPNGTSQVVGIYNYYKKED